MENFTLDTLTALPLFQGIGKSELTQFSTSVPHRIVQYAEGENLAEQDHPCRHWLSAVPSECVLGRTTTVSHSTNGYSHR